MNHDICKHCEVLAADNLSLYRLNYKILDFATRLIDSGVLTVDQALELDELLDEARI